MDKVSVLYFFSFLRYQTKFFIKYFFRLLITIHFRQFINLKIYLRLSSEAMADREKKMKIRNIHNILRFAKKTKQKKKPILGKSKYHIYPETLK